MFLQIKLHYNIHLYEEKLFFVFSRYVAVLEQSYLYMNISSESFIK